MLTVVSPQEAVKVILSCVNKRDETESVDLINALGRVTSENIISPEDLPSFTRSAVDGFALKAQDTYGCSESLPAMLEFKGKILMGQKVNEHLNSDCCMEIPTGGMLPEGADAVAMIEHTESIDDKFRYILKSCAVLENVIRQGDDCKTGDIVVHEGTVINARNTAVLSALGINKVNVITPPTIGVISTGNELVPITQKPLKSQVRDVNSTLLCSCIYETGCKAKIYPIVPDEESELTKVIKKAVTECDCLLISGGSSVGERDVVFRVISAIGEIMFHGIAVKPGKPTMFAKINNLPVFGLPGHPAAAFFAFHLFVKPALFKMLSRQEKEMYIQAVSAQNIPSNHGREEIVAVKLEGNNAIALFAKSGAVSVLSQADGYISIDRNSEGVLKGDKVKVILF